MPAEKGSQWSKNPIRDRRDDDRAVLLDIRDELRRLDVLLARRFPEVWREPQTQDDAPPLERRSA